MQIKFLEHCDIDLKRWDESISQSKNQLSYAQSWYLNIVSPNWGAIVSEEYEYLMPLPIKKKFGLPYLVQPFLTQQLGIFSKSSISVEISKQFIKTLWNFSYELNLNEDQYHPDAIEFPNYILDLNNPYKNIRLKYSKNTIRNIDKARKFNLTINSDLSIDDFIRFYLETEKNFNSIDETMLQKLISEGMLLDKMKLYGIYSNQNKLIASLCTLKSNKRITNLIPISNSEGKTSSSMFFLIDNIFQSNACTNNIFDFEGSSIEGIARFYKGFGAIYKPYQVIKQFRPSFLIGKICK